MQFFFFEEGAVFLFKTLQPIHAMMQVRAHYYILNLHKNLKFKSMNGHTSPQLILENYNLGNEFIVISMKGQLVRCALTN